MLKFIRKHSFLTALVLTGLVAVAYAQDRRVWSGHFTYGQASPQVRFDGTLNFQTLSGTNIGYIASTGGGFRSQVTSASSGTTTITASQTEGTFVNTGTSGTTTFTLPAASTAGLRYCFVENGNAAGELLINVQTGDNVVGRGITDTAGTTGATAIATSASFGIKNTAATNVRGDFTCLVSDGTTTWLMTSVMGVWATQ